MRLVDMPLSKRLIESRLGLAESYAFWAKHDNGFPRPCRDLVSTDVRNNVRESVRRDLSRLLTPKRDRLLLKFTGWPRIGYLQEIFPDAHFIHVVRDGRAVANSNITTPQWWGWRGPQNWRLGELTPEMMHEWEKYGRSFVVLAGLYWRIIVDAVESTKTAVSEDRFTQIRYEDFINAPLDTYENVASRCGLNWEQSFERKVRGTDFYDPGEKWKKNFTDYQQGILEECLRPHLERYGYVVPVGEPAALTERLATAGS